MEEKLVITVFSHLIFLCLWSPRDTSLTNKVWKEVAEIVDESGDCIGLAVDSSDVSPAKRAGSSRCFEM